MPRGSGKRSRAIGQPFAEKSAHQLLAVALTAAGETGDARAHRRRADVIDAVPVAPDARLIAALIADNERSR